MTAISSYTFMAMIEFLTSPGHDKSHGLGFNWPAKTVLEDMLPKKISDAVANGTAHANGHTSGSVKRRLE